SWLLRAPEVDAAIVDAAGRQRQVRIAPADAPARYAGGFTICANVSGEPAVAALLTELAYELGLAGAPLPQLYSSPDARGFAIHFDSFHVFVVQLRGAKRGRFSATPAVEAPLASGKLDAGGRPVWSRTDGAEEPILTDDGEPIPAPDLAAF